MKRNYERLSMSNEREGELEVAFHSSKRLSTKALFEINLLMAKITDIALDKENHLSDEEATIIDEAGITPFGWAGYGE